MSEPGRSGTDAAGAAAASASGTLSIQTNPSPLACLVLDHRMATVWQGASPSRVTLPVGLYVVRATRAGHPDLVRIQWVERDTDLRVVLSADAPGKIEPARATVSDEADELGRKDPTLAIPIQTARPANALERFVFRFARLESWTAAAPVRLPPATAQYAADGRAILGVTNPQPRVLFVQVARSTGPALNVAIPPAGVRPARCEVVVEATAHALAAHVRLSTEWANAAVQYLARGYIAEARDLVKTAIPAEPSIPKRFVRWLMKRFDDPAAACVPRYLGLRTREATIFNTLGDTVLDVFQSGLADGRVISAEVAARAGNYKLAASHLAGIQPGSLPLFTEGFSLLVGRVHDLLDLDLETVPADRRPDDDQTRKLRDLQKVLGTWAPYADLNAPTVTFAGDDLLQPKVKEDEGPPPPREGWLRGPEPRT